MTDTPTPNRPGHPPSTVWALHIDTLNSCLLLSTTHDGEPTLHLILAVPARTHPERSLNQTGWHSCGHWHPKPWGQLAPAEPCTCGN